MFYDHIGVAFCKVFWRFNKRLLSEEVEAAGKGIALPT